MPHTGSLLLRLRFYLSQRDNAAAKWTIPEDFRVGVGDAAEGELEVGGVFLRLFIANPGWVLRKPKEFMVELLEKWSQLVSQPSPNVSDLLSFNMSLT